MAVHSSFSSQFTISPQVEAALKKAASITGADFQYLVDTAARESGFRTSVKAPTSSASGLFQFIESTWLEVVKEHGAEHGLKSYADQIVRGKSGRYRVADPEARQKILKLRNDPEVASIMAGVFTQNNAAHLEAKLKRQPTAGELYIAHFLGAGNGGKLVKAAELNPTMKAAALFPDAARANKSLFYKRGRAVSVEGLYHNLVRRHQSLSHGQAVADASKTPELAGQKIAQSGIFTGWNAHVSRVEGLFELGDKIPPSPGTPLLNPKEGGDVAAAGQIGVWGHGGLALQAEEVSASSRVRSTLALADARAKQAPLLDLGEKGQEKARGLFQKGGLGSLKG